MEKSILILLLLTSSLISFAQSYSDLIVSAIDKGEAKMLLEPLELNHLNENEITLINNYINEFIKIKKENNLKTKVIKDGNGVSLVKKDIEFLNCFFELKGKRKSFTIQTLRSVNLIINFPVKIEINQNHYETSLQVVSRPSINTDWNIEDNFLNGLILDLLDQKFTFLPKTNKAFREFKNIYASQNLSLPATARHKVKNKILSGEFWNQDNVILLKYEFEYEIKENSFVIKNFKYEDLKNKVIRGSGPKEAGNK